MTTTQNVSIIKEEYDKIVTLCEQPNTALKAIHKTVHCYERSRGTRLAGCQ